MGSPCEVQLYAATPAAASSAVRIAMSEVERLEGRYSRYRSDSLLSGINEVAARSGEVDVDEETARLLDYAGTCYAESDGLFDITSGILRRAWHFELDGLPDPAEVSMLLDRVGWTRLRWYPPRLSFPIAGMEIDLGGVVKEYAADRVAALWLQAGLRHGMVNLGGDVRIAGPHPDGRPWSIGLRDPRHPDRLICSIPLRGGGLASSGDYERCIQIDGVRYSHLLDPRTGWPVRHMAAVSVASDLCILAGSTATIAMLRQEEGPGFLKASGLPHLWADVDGTIGGPWARGSRTTSHRASTSRPTDSDVC